MYNNRKSVGPDSGEYSRRPEEKNPESPERVVFRLADSMRS
jgi:hypothetical protein